MKVEIIHQAKVERHQQVETTSLEETKVETPEIQMSSEEMKVVILVIQILPAEMTAMDPMMATDPMTETEIPEM